MTKGLIATAGLVVFGSWAAVAGAQPAAAGAREGRAGEARAQRALRMDRPDVVRQLGLTGEQAESFRRLQSDERKQAIRRRADVAIARLELEEALDAPAVDEKLVASRVKAVSDLQAAEVRARADRRLALRKLLTPEQQEKLRQLTRERVRARSAVRRGPGRDPLEPGR